MVTPPEEVPDELFIGGIQINEPDADEWLSTLKAAGMNTVEVTVYGRNGDWNSKWMKYEEEDLGVMTEIRAAKKKGLKVVLILRQALDHYYPKNKFLWHGMIHPKSEGELAEWFATYKSFVAKWSKIAEEEGVDVLVIGSELNALASTTVTDSIPETIAWFKDSTRHRRHEERVLKYKDSLQEGDLWVRGFPNYSSAEKYIGDRVRAHYAWAVEVGQSEKKPNLKKINERRTLLHQHWDSLITETRENYSGLISYAANFDNYKEVAFWDKLDFIGINAYFPLRDSVEWQASGKDSERLFRDRWVRILNDISAFQSENELSETPVMFTELGYTNRSGCTLMPWKGHGFSVVGKGKTERLVVWEKQKVDPAERVAAVRALRGAVAELKFPLLGVLYWKLSAQKQLLSIEPFALHVADPPTDSLQVVLADFVDLPVPKLSKKQ